MKTANKSRIMRPHQNISLKLKQIDFAKSLMPEVQDPASTSLFAFSNLEVIPEEMKNLSYWKKKSKKSYIKIHIKIHGQNKILISY